MSDGTNAPRRSQSLLPTGASCRRLILVSSGSYEPLFSPPPPLHPCPRGLNLAWATIPSNVLFVRRGSSWDGRPNLEGLSELPRRLHTRRSNFAVGSSFSLTKEVVYSEELWAGGGGGVGGGLGYCRKGVPNMRLCPLAHPKRRVQRFPREGEEGSRRRG